MLTKRHRNVVIFHVTSGRRHGRQHSLRKRKMLSMIKIRMYEYKLAPSNSASALVQWQFLSNEACSTRVLPDGCRDIIIKENSDADQTCFLTDLSDTAYTVPSEAGTSMRGIRLQPGTQVNIVQLNTWLSTGDPHVLFESDQLDEFCFSSANLSDALACLASGTQTVACTATQLGVSIRSLQRLVKAQTGCSPNFWFSLARARKGARALHVNNTISDAAFETGFADQAHMTRAMRQWFGRTPKQIKSDKEMFGLLSEPAYC